MYVEHIT